MAERGEHSAGAAQIATLDTRRAKGYRVPIHRLRAEWRARAEEHGLTRRHVDRVRGRPAPRESDGGELIEAERLADRLLSAKGLTRERAAFTRRDVVQAFAEAA